MSNNHSTRVFQYTSSVTIFNDLHCIYSLGAKDTFINCTLRDADVIQVGYIKLYYTAFTRLDTGNAKL